MAVLDEDYGTDLTLAEGGSGTWTVPTAPPARQPREWRSRYEHEHARAERGAAMTGAVECRYYGRDFTAEEMALLRALIAGPALLNRHALSKEFCRRIGWFKPDGGLKDMMARVTMLAMHRDALITLPARQGRQNRPGPVAFGPHTEPPLFPAPTTLDEVRPLDLRRVVRGTREGMAVARAKGKLRGKKPKLSARQARETTSTCVIAT